jgi:molecular chaperone GrpE
VSEEGKRPDREGWEGFAEEASGGNLGPSSELEEAMREAEKSHDARAAERHGRKSGAGSEELETALAAAQQEIAELKDRHLRLAADFENARRRGIKDREEASLFGHQNVVKDLLASVDNLERAIDHAKDAGGVAPGPRGHEGGEGNQEGLLEGVELVLREIQAVLARHGVVPIDAQGQPFDPALHEAMAQLPDGSVPANTVVQVFQPGYQLRGRLLRPARVLVSKAPADAEKKADD